MNETFQIEDSGLMPLDTLELTSVDGGDSVNMSYYGGEPHYTGAGFHIIADFLGGLYAGMTS